jgi:hypothetical protein
LPKPPGNRASVFKSFENVISDSLETEHFPWQKNLAVVAQVEVVLAAVRAEVALAAVVPAEAALVAVEAAQAAAEVAQAAVEGVVTRVAAEAVAAPAVIRAANRLEAISSTK